MTTRTLMTASAIILGLMGVAASFLPQEIVRALGGDAQGLVPLLVQLLGACYLGLAMLNWTAKENPIGGIYGRPTAIANFSHFTVGALALVKAVADGGASVPLWIATLIYGGFAIWFALVFFGSPVRSNAPTE